MVHALAETRRVLATDSILIDVRPLLDQWPIEVASQGGHIEAGRVTDLKEPLEDDAAANAAMQQAVSAATFTRELQQAVSFFYYWDTPKEMEAYLAENWSDVVEVHEDVWHSLRSSWASAGAEARVSLRMKLLLTRYRKPR